MENNKDKNLIKLEDNTNEIVNKIIEEQDLDKIKDLTHLFNITHAKKNILRVLKLDNLMDTVSDKMIERFEKRPNEFSNADLLNYLQVTQNTIEKSVKIINAVDETPAISYQQNNQININMAEDNSSLTKESRDKVISAIDAFLSRINKSQDEEESSPITIINNDDDLSNGSNSLLNTED